MSRGGLAAAIAHVGHLHGVVMGTAHAPPPSRKKKQAKGATGLAKGTGYSSGYISGESYEAAVRESGFVLGRSRPWVVSVAFPLAVEGKQRVVLTGSGSAQLHVFVIFRG